MQPTGKREPIQLSVGLYFGPRPPRRGWQCCGSGRQNIDIPPGQARYTVRRLVRAARRCNAAGRAAACALSSARGARRGAHAGRPSADASRHPRLELPLATSLPLRVRHRCCPPARSFPMHYTYDNSAANPRNPEQPPARAEWGQRSAEEMGDFWLQVMTRSEADLLALNRSFRPKAVREDLVGYESLIRRTPDDPGIARRRRGVPPRARRRARGNRPLARRRATAAVLPSAHFNLAIRPRGDRRPRRRTPVV